MKLLHRLRGPKAVADVSGELDLVVERKEAVSDGVVRLTLADALGGDLPRWSPGAHVDLLLRPDLVRQYSLCGDTEDRSRLQVAVLREPDGRGGSAYVHDELREGDALRIRGPRNNFPLVRAQRYLFVAGGIGITPFLPMMAAAEATRADWRLVYGGRTRASMAFADHLARTYTHHVLLRPQDQYGLLDLPAVLGEPDPHTAVYTCGPEPLLSAVEETCDDWPEGALHLERFAPRRRAVAPHRAPFDVELARSARTVTVSGSKTVLQAVQEAGVRVSASCAEGICGSCETTVLSGEIDHQDSVLSSAERAEGRKMMICVSQAKGDHLVLDL